MGKQEEEEEEEEEDRLGKRAIIKEEEKEEPIREVEWKTSRQNKFLENENKGKITDNKETLKGKRRDSRWS